MKQEEAKSAPKRKLQRHAPEPEREPGNRGRQEEDSRRCALQEGDWWENWVHEVMEEPLQAARRGAAQGSR